MTVYSLDFSALELEPGLGVIEALIPELGSIKDPKLRDQCKRVLVYCFSNGNYGSPADAPFLANIPTDQAGGIDHLRVVGRLAAACAGELEQVLGVAISRDYALAAGLIHDVSKWFEYEPDAESVSGHRRSLLAKALPHPQFGVALCMLVGLPEEITNAVAWHSPSNALATESVLAVVLHHADMIAGDVSRMRCGLPSALKSVTV